MINVKMKVMSVYLRENVEFCVSIYSRFTCRTSISHCLFPYNPNKYMFN